MTLDRQNEKWICDRDLAKCGHQLIGKQHKASAQSPRQAEHQDEEAEYRRFFMTFFFVADDASLLENYR
ncbi:MAG TPA: hypothetical protein VIX59_03455 [Candidatus Binataceae bacterium]